MKALESNQNTSRKFYRNYIKYFLYLYVLIGLTGVYAGSYEDFFSAVNGDDGSAITALLARGFDGNVTDPKGDHALHVAIRDKSLKAGSALLAWNKINGEPRNKADESPLMLADLDGQLEIGKR